MSKGKKKAIDEELEDLQKEDDEEEDVQNEQLEDQMEAAMFARGSNTWAAGGVSKDIAIRVLIQCFGSMVESIPREDAVPDHRGRFRNEDMVHRKLLDAAKQVVRAKGILLKNENFDSRDFTLFIARKKWSYNILRPLLELCAKEDSALAMKICSLALVLIKKISDKTMKQIQNAKKQTKRPSQSTIDPNNKASLEDDPESRSESEITGVLANAKEQTAALLSFKEALCSEKCNEAITNAFREYWMKEQQVSTPDTKIGVAICLSYFRRILAISAHTDWSTPHELLQQQVVHHQYIVQLRVLLSLIPAIMSDLRRNYHDDWLGDVLLILYYIVQSFDPFDMYLVWKSNGVMPHFRDLLNMSEDIDEKPAQSITANSSKDKANIKNNTVQVPSTLSKQYQVSSLSKGSLSNKLAQERQQRLQSTGMLQMQPRFGNRFTGTYCIPVGSNGTASGSNANKSANISSSSTNAGSSQSNTAPAGTINNAAMDVDDDDPNAGGVKSIAPDAMLIRNPFSLHTTSLPSGKTKRNKKNLSFAKENPFLRTTLPSLIKSSPNSQQACVVVTSLIDIVLDEACFKSFIRRINEDLRRDEMRITSDMELQYFHIVMKCLEFYRYTLQDSYQKFLTDGSTVMSSAEEDDEEANRGWKPHLINVIDTLDKMSFTRVIFAIDRLNKNSQTMDKVEYPLTLYKEMLSYLHILLYSSLEGHHDIALGALYRLFYSSSERLDPLPKLLSHWKPATYTKTMTTTLLEVWLLTLQVQELVKQVFANKGIYTEQMYLIYKQKNAKKNKSAKGKKAELDMEQYLLSLLRFRNEEYLLKVCHSNSINMLMRVVDDVIETSNAHLVQPSTSSTRVHEVIYELLQRISLYPLYTDGSNPAPVMDQDLRYQSTIYGRPTEKTTDNSALNSIQTMSSYALRITTGYQLALPRTLPKVHLGYLFFTLRSFMIMHTFMTSVMNANTNTILLPKPPSNDSVDNVKTLFPVSSLAPIGRMFTLIIHSFQELTASNHMMYVELLCPTTTGMTNRLVDHYQHFSTIYDAKEHLLYHHLNRDEDGNKKGKGNYGDEFDKVSVGSIGDSSSSEDSDLGDEFDENQAFTKSKMSEKDEKKIKKAQKLKSSSSGGTKPSSSTGDKVTKKRLKKNRRADSSSDENDFNEKEGSSSSEDEKKRSKKKGPKKLTEEEEQADQEEFEREVRASRKKWSTDEDNLLKQLYSQFAGSRSVFASIMHNDEFKALNTRRNERQIANRVKELQLHLAVANAQQEEDDDDTGKEEAGDGDGEATLKQTNNVMDDTPNEKEPAGSKQSSKPYWELNDDEQDDIFEKRSLGLLMHTRALYDEEETPNNNNAATKTSSSNKRTLDDGSKGKSKGLKKQKKGIKSRATNDDDDDDINFDESDNIGTQPTSAAPMDEQETAPQFADEIDNNVSTASQSTYKARGMLLDSDEEN